MSAERLALALWGEDAPAGAVKTVQVYVSRLRKALGDAGGSWTTPARLLLERGARGARRRVLRAPARGRPRGAGGGRCGARGRRCCAGRWGCGGARRWTEFAWAPFAPAEIARLEELRLGRWRRGIDAEPGRRAARRAGRRAAAAHRRAPVARAAARAADARAVPQRPPGRGAGGLPARPRDAWSSSSGSSRDPSCRSSSRRSWRTSARSTPARARAAVGGGAAAGAAELARSARAARGAGGRRAAAHGLGAAADADRARRGREDAAGARGGARGRGRLRRRRLFRLARAVRAGARDVAAAIVSALGDRRRSRASRPSRRSSASSPPSTCCWSSDNCEHLPAAAPFIGDLPSPVPAVTVLATSREPLAVQAEQRLSGRAARAARAREHDPAAMADVAAVALFCERARAHDPEFELDDGNAARRRGDLPAASTGCRWRSSSRPRAAGCCRPPRSPSACDGALGTLGAGPRDAPARQRRCARRSTGATSC